MLGKQRRKFPLQEVGVADVEFDQAAQVGHAVDVDRVANKAGLATFDMSNRALHADLLAVFEVDVQYGSGSADDIGVLRQADERAFHGQVQDLHFKLAVGENQLRR